MKPKFQAKRQTYVKEMKKNIKENTEQDKQDSLLNELDGRTQPC